MAEPHGEPSPGGARTSSSRPIPASNRMGTASSHSQRNRAVSGRAAALSPRRATEPSERCSPTSSRTRSPAWREPDRDASQQCNDHQTSADDGAADRCQTRCAARPHAARHRFDVARERGMSSSVFIARSPRNARGQRLQPAMDRDLDIGFADARLRCCLGDAQPIDPGRADRVRLLWPAAFEQIVDVHLRDRSRLRSLLRSRCHPEPRSDFVPPAAEMIDHLVAGDREQPCREGAIAVVGRTPGVNGDQRLLDQILDLIGGGIRRADRKSAAVARGH